MLPTQSTSQYNVIGVADECPDVRDMLASIIRLYSIFDIYIEVLSFKKNLFEAKVKKTLASKID